METDPLIRPPERAETQRYQENLEKLREQGIGFAEVYESACELFPEAKELMEVEIIFIRGSGSFSAGKDIVPRVSRSEAVPVIKFGTSEFLASSRAKAGTVTRLGVDKDAIFSSEMGNDLMRVAIFAHEVSHILQLNETIRGKIGPLAPSPRIRQISGQDMTQEDYEKYVMADKERNADYFARIILAHCPDVNQYLKVEAPEEELQDWREWAENNLPDFHPNMTVSAA